MQPAIERRSIIPRMKLKQLSPLLLGRLAVGGYAQASGLAHLGGLFASGQAFRRFAVKQLGFRGASSNDRQSLNHHRTLVESGPDLKLVTHPRFLSRLATFATAMHLTAFDGRFGQRSGFEETRCP